MTWQANAYRTRERPLHLKRRSLFTGSAAAIGASVLPYGASQAAQSNAPVMTALTAYMSDARDGALPEEVTEKAKHHILDTLAAMISGSTLPAGKAAINLARAYGGQNVATVVASKILCSPIEAALANGMLAHSDETDDSHAPSQSHPGCSIVPAALAAGELSDITGSHFLRAVVLGYDVGTRVTMNLLKAKNFQRISTHSLAGTFGSAAAAGCAAGLDPGQMRWLLDYAALEASGVAVLQRDSSHVEKSFLYGGMPARNGMTAALLAKANDSTVVKNLEPADRFLLAFAPDADPNGLLDQLGARYEVTRTNIKKWSVGSPIQAALDALEVLQKQHSFEADQVRQVVVRLATAEAAAVNNNTLPDVCLQHMVAVMLIDKTASFLAAHDLPRMQDPDVLRQRAKVQLVADEELERRRPRREGIVEITLQDGTNFSEHVEAVRGTAENPMTRDEIIAKSRDLIAPVLGAKQAERLMGMILNLETLKSLRELRPLLQKT